MMTILFNLLFSLIGFAGLQEDFLDLKDRGRNLMDTGAICEEVAGLNLQRQYGPQYTVLTGIEYSDQDGVVGELDVVVFENSTNTAVLIGEVKCWRDLRAGLSKALEQRQRFQTFVNSRRTIYFKWKEDHSLKLTKTQFNKTQNYVAIAQKGATLSGYDLELDYSLGQLMELRETIMGCQARGQCERPRNY